MRAGLLVLTLAVPAAAQDAVPESGPRPGDIAEIDVCLTSSLEAGDAAEECVGIVSGPCMEAADGATTVGMMACMGRETQAWDAILNDQWPKLMQRARSLDGGAVAQDQPGRAETLRDAQRAWIAFRDAECAHAYASGGDGSIRRILGASCLLDLTAERAIDFHERLVEEARQ